MLRVTALPRFSTPLLLPVAPLRHVRGLVLPTTVMSSNQATETEGDGRARRSFKTGQLEKKLQALQFPKIDRKKMQDQHFIAVAEVATEIIRELDDARSIMPRYWKPQEYAPSDTMLGDNYKLESEDQDDDDHMLADGDKEVDDAMDESMEEEEQDPDAAEFKSDLTDRSPLDGDDMDESVILAMRRHEMETSERDSDLFDEIDDFEKLDMDPQTIREREIAKSELTPEEYKQKRIQLRRDITSSDRAGYSVDANMLRELEEDDKYDQDGNLLSAYESKLVDAQEEAMNSMGDNKFLNQGYRKPPTNRDSLKAWFNEYKFVQAGGRHSLADQTARHAKFMKDYEIRLRFENEATSKNSYESRSGFEVNEVLQVGRHCKVTKGGRIYSYSTLVLVGTGKGTAGFGYGKGSTAADATTRAFVDAERNLISVPLYRGGLPNGFNIRKRGSFMKLWVHTPRADMNWTESNMIPHPIMSTIVSAFGWNNVNMRTWKRRNWHNMMEGLFTQLPRMVSHPEDTARKMGMKLKVLGVDERFDRLKPHYL